MTEATLIPASDQVQLMLDSALTESEQQQLAAMKPAPHHLRARSRSTRSRWPSACWRSTTTNSSGVSKVAALGRLSEVP